MASYYCFPNTHAILLLLLEMRSCAYFFAAFWMEPKKWMFVVEGDLDFEIKRLKLWSVFGYWAETFFWSVSEKTVEKDEVQ